MATVRKTTTSAETASVKKFKDTDMIRCVSCTAGKLVMVGMKTKDPYIWVSEGDTVDVPYIDIIAAIRSRSNYVYRPRFVIDDPDFIAQHKDLDTLYSRLYSKSDLMSVFDMPAARMKKAITQLPDGVKETVKSLAITAIENGSMDSISKIKAIDEIFGTQMLIKMTS